MQTYSSVLQRGWRMKIKTFKTSRTMYKFLQTGSNALKWRQSDKRLKTGVYAYAGGQWHNVRSLDPSALNHI